LVPVSPAKKLKVQMAKSYDFGPSLMTEEAIKSLEEEGCFLEGKGHLPCGETVPRPEVDEAIMFKDFFACGLWIPSTYFLRLVLETFKVQLHHLMPTVHVRRMGLRRTWTPSACIMSFSASPRRRRSTEWRWSTGLPAVHLWRRGCRRRAAWRYPSLRRTSGRRTGPSTSSM